MYSNNILFFCSLLSVCNFVIHDRCLRSLVTPCTGVATSLIKVSFEFQHEISFSLQDNCTRYSRTTIFYLMWTFYYNSLQFAPFFPLFFFFLFGRRKLLFTTLFLVTDVVCYIYFKIWCVETMTFSLPKINYTKRILRTSLLQRNEWQKSTTKVIH